MRNPTDTFDLRNAFANEFLASPQEHDDAIVDGPMEHLITQFDAELAKAKRHWKTVNVDAEWANMDQWLSDHGYVDPDQLNQSLFTLASPKQG